MIELVVEVRIITDLFFPSITKNAVVGTGSGKINQGHS